MKLVSVNVGASRPIAGAGKSGFTGIFKEPQSGLVSVGRLGLSGDAIVDTENHGGPDQAVYVFSTEDYAWWSDRVGRELAPGTFGENLTVSGFRSAEISVGDRFVIGEVVLEVTGPRIPCGTVSARMKDRLFVKKFRAAERPGVYCRVIRKGRVRAGEGVGFEPYFGELDPPLGVIEDFREFFEPHNTEATLRRQLAAPIAVRDRVYKERLLLELRSRQASSQ
ncbi:MOSC domain-containing protein [Rubrobacter indicoceani]|uniref:MOSC domain-containing protein n=1 Tax=Rubrobacter indicoceani TaxID=2051957 RepID=UPI000E5AC34D|nr:MOSC domain-containing protein [Rubrobacter indicoceani]